MLLGNYSVIHKSPGKFFGGTSVSNVSANFGKNGQLRAIYSEATIPDQWGLPVGYYSGWMLPRTAGYIVASSDNVLNSTANPVMGVNGVGNCDITLTALADLSLVVSSAGTCNIIVTATGQTIGTIYGAGTSNITLSANGTVGAIAFGNGQGSISLVGSADIAAKGFMTGSMNPFTELSPEGLANAVWSALASENNVANTMGAKLNTASSGGVDMGLLAQAVWEYATRTLTSGGGGATPAEIWDYSTRTLTSGGGTNNTGNNIGAYAIGGKFDFPGFSDDDKKKKDKIDELSEKIDSIPEIDLDPVMEKLRSLDSLNKRLTQIQDQMEADRLKEKNKEKEIMEVQRLEEKKNEEEVQKILKEIKKVEAEHEKNILKAIQKAEKEHEKEIEKALKNL